MILSPKPTYKVYIAYICLYFWIRSHCLRLLDVVRNFTHVKDGTSFTSFVLSLNLSQNKVWSKSKFGARVYKKCHLTGKSFRNYPKKGLNEKLLLYYVLLIL